MTCHKVPKIVNFLQCVVLLNIFVLFVYVTCEIDYLPPTIFICIFCRNKAHVLPYFFGYLEQLDYPKDRISLWLRSDHNSDDTTDVIKTWLDSHRSSYHSIDFDFDDLPSSFPDENGIFDWSPLHYKHLIHLKEYALDVARRKWADYVFFLDSDVFLVNNQTLKLLIKEDKTLVAPVIETIGAYSNFWCGMTETGYYKRTEDYLPILEREKTGCFDVPMIHSAVFINLHHALSQNLTFDPKHINGYSGPIDDIIVFAHSARTAGIKMWITNKEIFGYMLSPPDKKSHLGDDKEQLLNLKVEMLVDQTNIIVSPQLQHLIPKETEDTLGFDEVYLINLERRTERKDRMLKTLSEIGVHANVIKAVDGQALNDTFIDEMGIKMLPEYSDPYHKRPLKRGEIGCFLSHYNVWKDVVEKQHRTALVFEDDLRFEPYFRKKIQSLLKEVQKVGLLWDLIYLGRKRLSDGEPPVTGTSTLVHVKYSYWTLSYLITLQGAKKLIAANPLNKLIPVDEFLPIMFDRHPEEVWKSYYPKRNLKAFSVQPLLVFPTHYTGEEHYVSDTEDSDIALSVVREEL